MRQGSDGHRRRGRPRQGKRWRWAVDAGLLVVGVTIAAGAVAVLEGRLHDITGRAAQAGGIVPNRTVVAEVDTLPGPRCLDQRAQTTARHP